MVNAESECRWYHWLPRPLSSLSVGQSERYSFAPVGSIAQIASNFGTSTVWPMRFCKRRLQIGVVRVPGLRGEQPARDPEGRVVRRDARIDSSIHGCRRRPVPAQPPEVPTGSLTGRVVLAHRHHRRALTGHFVPAKTCDRSDRRRSSTDGSRDWQDSTAVPRPDMSRTPAVAVAAVVAGIEEGMNRPFTSICPRHGPGDPAVGRVELDVGNPVPTTGSTVGAAAPPEVSGSPQPAGSAPPGQSGASPSPSPASPTGRRTAASTSWSSGATRAPGVTGSARTR